LKVIAEKYKVATAEAAPIWSRNTVDLETQPTQQPTDKIVADQKEMEKYENEAGKIIISVKQQNINFLNNMTEKSFDKNNVIIEMFKPIRLLMRR
jgi:hypothetical protein